MGLGVAGAPADDGGQTAVLGAFLKRRCASSRSSSASRRRKVYDTVPVVFLRNKGGVSDAPLLKQTFRSFNAEIRAVLEKRNVPDREGASASPAGVEARAGAPAASTAGTHCDTRPGSSGSIPRSQKPPLRVNFMRPVQPAPLLGQAGACRGSAW